ncbi:MAG: glycosyltransferase family 4 protein [Thermoleophilia bacterium]|nr:glycosyltransferase family 4 protein [Thermoleophilia bacterium]
MHVLSAILFFPRGGSAQVARDLATYLPEHDCDVTLLAGSLGSGLGDARTFYAGLDPRVVDFDRGDAPMHPSYEDRPGAPDRCFARLGDEEYSAQVHAWSRAMEKADAAGMDALHLHHLTPMNEAAARVAPDVPVFSHLHGTELAMLERIAAGPPETWAHAESWARRMRRWAGSSSRLIMQTLEEIPTAAALLMVDEEKFTAVPNGFDPEIFKPEVLDRGDFWHRHLVEDPQGWKPGEPAGSVSYSAKEVAVLDKAVVLVAVGRFTEVKRLGLMVRAFEQARQRARRPIALVLVGGHPAEWEGEHPIDAIAASGASHVFLAGWHDHAGLSDFFNVADAQVLASVREQFGLVLVEGMACALPPIAVDRFGPKAIIEDGRTGWLVPPDDQSALTAAIVDAVDDGEERSRRGLAGRREATARYGWPAIAGDMAKLLHEAAEPTVTGLRPIRSADPAA